MSVCPQALQALREQCLAFSYGKSQDLHEEAGWPTDEVGPFVLFQMFALHSDLAIRIDGIVFKGCCIVAMKFVFSFSSLEQRHGRNIRI